MSTVTYRGAHTYRCPYFKNMSELAVSGEKDVKFLIIHILYMSRRKKIHLSTLQFSLLMKYLYQRALQDFEFSM